MEGILQYQYSFERGKSTNWYYSLLRVRGVISRLTTKRTVTEHTPAKGGEEDLIINTSLIQKEERKRNMERIKTKINCRMEDLNPNISLSIIHINYLNNPKANYPNI